jgi:cysteine desulfurase
MEENDGGMNGYFDHNATTPMSEAARQAWLEAADRSWQNPSGLYREAGAAKRVLEDWREALADHFGVDEPERVVFTSGATEANNAVIAHLAGCLSGCLVTSEIEHPCVEAAAHCIGDPSRVRRLPTNPATGAADLTQLKEWIAAGEVGAVSLMAANNETGVLQAWREASALCRDAGISFHTDAAQWIGKLPVAGLGEAGYVTGSGHKFGGGKGVGFVILPEEEGSLPFHGFVGGPQEHGRRAGTENLPGVAAMVTALLGRDDETLEGWSECQGKWRDAFESRIAKELGVRLLATAGARLWNTSMFVLPHSKNLKWLTRLSQRGFAVSTGSACSAGQGNPSAVMMAMGLDYEEMGRVLRVSGGGETTAEEWADLAAAIIEVGGELASPSHQ